MADEPLQFLEIVDWDRYLHPDTRRKCEPPFRWCKLPLEHLDTLGDLTLREFGAFCRLLLLAATTDNRTVFKPGFIRRRSGVSRSAIESLLNRNLVRLVPGTDLKQESQLDQAPNPTDASTPLAMRQQGAGVEERERRGDNNTPVGNSPRIPAPQPRNGQSAHTRGIDRRSFAELKDAVLPVAIRLNTRDPDELHRLAGQGLRMTRKQLATALHQLTQDGRL